MKIHTIVTVDPKKYDDGLITRIHDVYSNMSKIHIVIMGARTKEILPLLRKEYIDTITEITAPTFNYAYAVNYTIKLLDSKEIIDDDDLLVLSDSWNVVSLLQIDSQIKQTNFNKSFIYIDIYRDTTEEPLNKNSKRYMLSIAKRIKTTKEKRRPQPQKLIPVPIISFNQFKKSGGLEEKLFTDLSRLYLIEFLDKSGNERILSTFDGIRLSYDPVYDFLYTELDMNMYKTLKEINITKSILRANTDHEWGDPLRLKYLKIINKIPTWRYEEEEKVSLTVIEKPKDNIIENQITEKPIPLPIKQKIPISGFEAKFQDTLVMVRNNIEDVALASNIIKKLYLEHGPVTILTDRLHFTAVDVLKSFMVREIKDLSQYNAQPFSKGQFKKIYRLGSFTKSITFDDIIDITQIEEHNPYCSSVFPKKQIPDNSICFVLSSTGEGFKKINNDMWNVLIKVSKKIIDYNIPIFFLGMLNEKSFIDNLKTKNNEAKLISISVNRDYQEAASILNFCKVVVTNPETSAMWLSYALKKKTIVVNSTTERIPETPWLIPINYTESDCASKILKMIIEEL